MSHAAYLDVQVGNRDELVTRHAPLVKRIAYHLLSRLPASVEVDDLIQAGMIGLLEAASNFRAGQGAGFETYASIRIRGAMIDQMRQGAWAPRSVSRQLRELAAAVNRVESRLGREAQAAEIAEEMGIDINDYYDLLSDTAAVRLVSLEQASDSGMEFSDEDDELLSCYECVVALFRRARVVIGKHGAGLVNIMAAAPGTVVMEMYVCVLALGLQRAYNSQQERFSTLVFFF